MVATHPAPSASDVATRRTDGAGPDVRKRIPSKRIRAAHRRHTSGSIRISLRAFARAAFDQGSPDESKLAKQWFANKGVQS